uniref:Uncharacterized protein n=1 Tax=Lepeophtheirus salmonis TaxID=72036 RepID=A0A0K2TRD1_LEPSM
MTAHLFYSQNILQIVRITLLIFDFFTTPAYHIFPNYSYCYPRNSRMHFILPVFNCIPLIFWLSFD